MKFNITIIVSSCDAYSDCWDPFFKLLVLYWPNISAQVVLVTDEKDYQCSYMDVKVFRAAVGQGGRRQTWGWNLMRCLESLNTDVILYLQEDFFLTAPVDEDMIKEFAGYISKMSWTHQSTMHIGLCARSSHGPFHLTEYPLLWEVDRNARYRFSLQPGLWKREALLKYLKPSDTAWNFEETSHLRARRTPDRILTINRHVFNLDSKQIYPFDPHGGIVRGKWVRNSVVDLFQKHEIKVDFCRRGFFDEVPVKELLQLTFLRRIGSSVKRRSILFQDRINEVIDSFRY